MHTECNKRERNAIRTPNVCSHRLPRLIEAHVCRIVNLINSRGKTIPTSTITTIRTATNNNNNNNLHVIISVFLVAVSGKSYIIVS